MPYSKALAILALPILMAALPTAAPASETIPGCEIPAADLDPPDLPDGYSGVERIVDINGVYRPELSTAPEGAASGSPLPTSVAFTHNWGKDCTGVVRFVFVPAAPEAPEDPPVDPNAPPGDPVPPPGGSQETGGDLPPVSGPEPGPTVPGSGSSGGPSDAPDANSGPAPSTELEPDPPMVLPTGPPGSGPTVPQPDYYMDEWVSFRTLEPPTDVDGEGVAVPVVDTGYDLDTGTLHQEEEPTDSPPNGETVPGSAGRPDPAQEPHADAETPVGQAGEVWNLGTLQTGSSYPTEVSAVNLCRGKRRFDITVSGAPWMEITGPSSLRVASGKTESTAARVNLAGCPPGVYNDGAIEIRCRDCPADCRQDVSLVRVHLTVTD